jgi:hypothetical protein
MGSSDALWNLRPVVICVCVFASLVWCSRMASMVLRWKPAVDRRMAYLLTALSRVSNSEFATEMICAEAAYAC